MSNDLLARLARRQNLAAVVAGGALIVFIGFLLIANYRSQVDLQKSVLDRLRHETKDDAAAVGHFFTERKDDMRNLAAGRAISVFYENKALGMSMEYGLRASLLAIADQFNRLIEDKKLGAERVYTRVVLVGADGEPLVDTAFTKSTSQVSPRDWKPLLAPESPGATIMIEQHDGGNELLACAPYFFKNEYAGQITAWINPRIVSKQVFHQDGSSRRFAAMVCHKGCPCLRDSIPLMHRFSSLPDLTTMQTGTPLPFETTDRDGAKAAMIAVRVPIEGAPLFLVNVVPASEVVGRTAPWHLLAATAAISLVVLGGVALGFRINTRNLVLQARLEEASQRQQEVELTNRQLHQEIAERKRAEEELARHRDHLDELVKERTDRLEKLTRQHELILDSAGEGIWGLDRHGNTAFVNPAAAKMLGWEVEELLGKPPHDLIHHTNSDGSPYPRDECLIHAAIGDGTVHHVTNEVFWRKDGTSFPVSYISTPIREGSELLGAVVTYQDITERKRAEAELKQAKEASEAANQSKSEFLANMSHEIRTPMTAILGFTDLLFEHGDLAKAPPERIEAIETIKRNGKHLLNVINDILDISRIEAGQMSIERIACSPFEMVEDVYSLMQVRAQDRDIPLKIEHALPVPATIQTDPMRLRQILVNLVGNGIKFTETGSVTTCISFEQDTEPRVRFDVIDTGIGIPRDQIVNIFEPFMQADGTTTRKFGGTGLGLTICKRLAGILGGDIDVTSDPGRGSTFSLAIPIGPLEGVEMRTSVRSDSPGAPALDKRRRATDSTVPCRILLVEDGPDNQRLILSVLTRAGAEVVVAENGKIAVEKALAAMFRKREGDPKHLFDVILMDMQMPVMDGYEATGLLRRKGYTGPIIALTAHAMKEDRQKCLNAGCNDYTTKPIDRKKLIAVIGEHLQERRAHPTAPQSASDIVVSEHADDADMIELVEMFIAELPDKVSAIEKALAEEDFATLAFLAHQLKGAPGGYGFPTITDLAKNLELSVKTGHSLDKVQKEVDDLAAVCRRARASTPTA